MNNFRKIGLLFLLHFCVMGLCAQKLITSPGLSPVTRDAQGRPVRRSQGNDSLKHRDALEDSITIYYRYFDSSRVRLIDSSINDFYSRFPVPYYYNTLGNLGQPATSLIFRPLLKPGFDAGFHAYDPYNFTVEDTRFFQTTRPYTELGYLIGSRGEQMIDVLHTQNRGKNTNVGFEYRLINSPGAFRNQGTNINNIRLNVGYQSTNKRYSAFFIFLNNKERVNENGGVRNERDLDSLALNDPFEIATRLGTNASTSRNFFNPDIITGDLYKENIFLLRQQYDIGQKDSLVVDTVTYRLFYPRIRLQHTFMYSTNLYSFNDRGTDSTLYSQFFNYHINTGDTVIFKDTWHRFANEFSVISFPVKNNLNQFLKLGFGIELVNGQYKDSLRVNLNDVYLAAEYRNRTRNQRWDLDASGKFYSTGPLAGDYSALVSLKRLLSRKLGYLEAGFQNINRSASYNYKDYTSFPLHAVTGLKKENVTRIFGSLDNQPLGFTLSAEYYVLKNYIYLDSFYRVNQQGALFNLLHLSAEKKIRLTRHLNWYTEAHIQQTTGHPPVNVPFFLIRNRIAFEGNFFQNLFLSTGLEIRYFTPYKANGYAALTNQFYVQDTASLGNRPDINLYLNFRIKSFKAFVRLENLNTFDFKNGGFKRYNYAAPHYPQQSMWIRLGIWWSFVN